MRRDWRMIAAAVMGAVVLGGTVTTAVVAAPPAAVPAASGPCTATPPSGSVGPFSGVQLANAATIIATSRSMAPPRASLVALATAMQESTLRNIDYGDRDSLGLFQQRPSQGWGTPAQVTDPVYATRKFVTWLLSIPGWERLPVTVAAQKVQRSAYPLAYAKWEPVAAQIVAATAVVCTPRST